MKNAGKTRLGLHPRARIIVTVLKANKLNQINLSINFQSEIAVEHVIIRVNANDFLAFYDSAAHHMDPSASSLCDFSCSLLHCSPASPKLADPPWPLCDAPLWAGQHQPNRARWWTLRREFAETPSSTNPQGSSWQGQAEFFRFIRCPRP